jgi:hypothetical protein
MEAENNSSLVEAQKSGNAGQAVPDSKRWKKSGAEAELSERQAHAGYSLREIDEIASDVRLWSVVHGKVRDLVTRDPVPFKPRMLQRRLFDQYQFCKERGVPFRAVMCKVRRGGGSTASEAILYCHAHNFNARLGAIGTDDSVSSNMFDFIDTFDLHDDFPGWPRVSKRLPGVGELKWPNGSSWEKYSAENPEAARSAGLQGYHASEVGRWPNGGARDASETLKSMLGAVPKRGFTVAIEESTAQGAAGAFYRRFIGGRWPSAEELGVSDGLEYWRKWEQETPQHLIDVGTELQFVRVFAAWFEDDENRADVTSETVEFISATLDQKERELIERYGSNGPQGRRLGDVVETATVYEQLAWRRSVIESEFDGDVEGFEQEYPSSPKEAFASSGRHSFNVAGCGFMVGVARSAQPEKGVLTQQPDGGVVFTRTEESEAWLHVWEAPRQGFRYLIGLDTMEGEEQVAGSKTHDFHAGITLRASYVDEDGVKWPHKTAAALAPKSIVEADVLAKQVDLVSRWYGRCLVVPEINRSGYGYLQEAKRLGTNLYRRERTDRFTSEVTDMVGWQTDEKTRPQLIAAMQAAIRHNASEATRCDGLDCKSVTLALECSTMVKNAKGKDEAASGCHDDHVLACGMALANIAGATYYAGSVRKRKGPPDRHKWNRFRPR